MRDFTLKCYVQFLQSLIKAGYSFQTFEQFLENPLLKVVVLRHDVDRIPNNSLATAQIENTFGVKGSYYFRIVKESNNPKVIKQIVKLGHEIGYHYETMDTQSKKLRVTSYGLQGNINDKLVDTAYESFCKNLEYFRTLYPVKTICMHGSPLSKYDNKDIWKKYDYKSLGLIGEPYFDVDFSKVLYLTDTGRRWDGERVSVRDKVQPKTQNPELKTFNRRSVSKGGQNPEPTSVNSQPSTLNFSFRHTKDIITAIDKGILPNQIMFTIHPQRWNDSLIPWTKELVMQNIKNIVKWGLIKVRS